MPYSPAIPAFIRQLLNRNSPQHKPSMRLPSKADWAALDPNDLEAPYIREHFFGKSFEDALELFENNAIFYGEELLSMPYGLFNFYAPALVAYLLSERARGDADGASSFLIRMSWLLDKMPELMSSDTKKLLLDASEKIAHSQDFYDASVDIYGNFLEQYAKIKSYV